MKQQSTLSLLNELEKILSRKRFYNDMLHGFLSHDSSFRLRNQFILEKNGICC